MDEDHKITIFLGADSHLGLKNPVMGRDITAEASHAIVRMGLIHSPEGTTILLVEQNAQVALKLADYGYVLEAGRIVIEDDGATLRQDESIVKAYLGGGSHKRIGKTTRRPRRLSLSGQR